MRRLLRDVFNTHPAGMLLLVSLLVVTSLTAGATIGLLIPLIETVQAGAAAVGNPVTLRVRAFLEALGLPFGLATVLAALLAVSLLRQALTSWATILGFQIQCRFAARLRTDFCGDLLEADIAFFDKAKVGELGSLISTETENARVACGILFSGLAALSLIAIGVAAALLISWEMAAIAVLVLLFSSLLSLPFVRRSSLGSKELEKAQAAFYSEVLETLMGVRTIRAFGTEKSAFSQYRDAAHLVRDKTVSINRGIAYHNFAQEFGQMTFLCGMIYVALKFLLIPWILLVTLLFVLYRLGPQVVTFNKSRQALASYLAGYEKMTRTREELARHRTRMTSGEKAIGGLSSEIEFSGVDFSYAGGAGVLDKLSLKIKAGEFVGVVGPSGAGKSTFVNLLLRFYDPTGGCILADGTNCREFRLPDWRAMIGFVGQDTFLFDASVRENIAVGKKEATLGEVTQAAKLADAHEFISALPRGYDTKVGEGGLRLSGGQKQRLALARALVRESSVILLDEATSHLDTESELQIRRALKKLPGNRTIIAVAHRLSSLNEADRIIVLDGGRVVEEGTRADLIARGGRFARMLKQQELEGAPPSGGG